MALAALSEWSSLSAQSPLGAEILPVEHTIRRWRVGTGQHTPHSTGGGTTGCNAAIPIRGGDHKVSTRLRKGAIPRVRDTLSRRQVECEPPIGELRHARVGNGEVGDETGLPRMFHRQRRRGGSSMSYGG